MKPIEKLQSLYQQLDSLASAGEDVVADIRKEINNLELAYLKEEVFPQIAAALSLKIKHLRCGLDCSFQYDEEGVINYSFCTTGSMLMIKDSIKVNEGTDALKDSALPIEVDEIKEKVVSDTLTSNVKIVDYSEKAIAVYGAPRHLAESFRQSGGYFKSRLKEGPGWVFSEKRRTQVETLLAPYLSQNCISNISINLSEDSYGNLGKNELDGVTEDDWINMLTNMRCMPYNGFTAPHKAIFVLTIIKAVQSGLQKDNRIYPSSRLESSYRILWNKYIPKNSPFTMNFYQPYAHMSNEPFYNIVKINERASFNINLGWTKVLSLRYIKYGIVDERLFNLLKNNQFTDKLTEALLTKYIYPLSQSFKSSKPQDIKEDLPNNYLSDFQQFLISKTNAQGKHLAPSSINVYVGSLKNEYMRRILAPYTPDGLLESISNLKTLDSIYEKVKNDAINGVISRGVRVALRLYLEFRLSKDSQTNYCGTSRTQNRTSTANPNEIRLVGEEQLKPHPNTLEIESITAEHIHITEGNPTSMFVHFINEIGPDLIADMHIYYLGGELVSQIPNPKYVRASKRLNNGYWVNTNSSTLTKIDQIKKISSYLGIEVEIKMKNAPSIHPQPSSISSNGRPHFSLNGQSPLNKRQSVLACVKLFMTLNPNVPFEVVERNFPSELQGSYGVVAKLAKVNSRIARGYDDNKRFFLDKYQILKAKDGVEFVVCSEWGNQFASFQAHVKKRFGWTLEEV